MPLGHAVPASRLPAFLGRGSGEGNQSRSRPFGRLSGKRPSPTALVQEVVSLFEIWRVTRAGEPMATTHSGMSRTTTAPAPTIAPAPTLRPGISQHPIDLAARIHPPIDEAGHPAPRHLQEIERYTSMARSTNDNNLRLHR